MKFKCDKCGSTVLQEILRDVTLASPITDCSPDELEYDTPETYDGYVDRYQCANCTKVILRRDGKTPIRNSEDLYNWLKEHDMLDE